MKQRYLLELEDEYFERLKMLAVKIHFKRAENNHDVYPFWMHDLVHARREEKETRIKMLEMKRRIIK